MTENPDERINQHTELIRRLFEEALKNGKILPGDINIIIAAAGQPKNVEPEVQQERRGPVIREPAFEHHELKGSVTITADLPGTGPEDIQYTLHGGVLYLAAHAEDIIYRAAYPVEEAVAETLTHTYKNGVIEFTYKKQDSKSGEGAPDSSGADETGFS